MVNPGRPRATCVVRCRYCPTRDTHDQGMSGAAQDNMLPNQNITGQILLRVSKLFLFLFQNSNSVPDVTDAKSGSLMGIH